MFALRIDANGNISAANESFYKCNIHRMRSIVKMLDANNWCGGIILRRMKNSGQFRWDGK